MTTVDSPNVRVGRHRRHVRRLPGPRQGDVQRRAVPRADAPQRRQPHQLGTGDGAGRVLRRRHRRAARPASTFCVPTGNFGNVLSGLDRAADGRADRPASSSPRNTNDILTRFFNDNDMTHRAGRADAQPAHGHPGVVELRAAAVRDERPRRRDDGRAAAALPRDRPADGRARPARRRSSTACSAPTASTTTQTLDVIARDVRRDARCCSTRTRRSRVGAARAASRGDVRPTVVTLATAHPAKFPDAVRAGDRRPPAAAAAPRRPVRPARAHRRAAQRPRRGAGASSPR